MATIYVVGLGPGDFTGLPFGTFDRLTSGLPVYLRTEVHPVVDELKARGVQFQSFDDLYETGEDFETIYEQMADRLMQAAETRGDIVYAVPGHPLMAERSVQNLLDRPKGRVSVEIGPGQSFLDPVCSLLHLDPIEGFLLLDGTSLESAQLQPSLHTFIAQVFHQTVASDVKLTLMEVYPDDTKVTLIRAAGVKGLEKTETCPLHEIDRVDFIDHLTTLYVPRQTGEARERDPWYVTWLIKRLRDEDGCPWDRKQTHQTLRPYVIEEAYEVAHAIDMDDPEQLSDELGDLFLQVLLHSQIASEYGEFTVRDVYQALASKIVRRHPHVFGDIKAETGDQAQAAWDRAKAAEKQAAAPSTTEFNEKRSLLHEVKPGMPAWHRAHALQKRAAKVGFDWPRVEDVMDKVKEEWTELGHEIRSENKQLQFEEFGDLMFVLVNLARWLDIDLDSALAYANDKFVARFQYVERCVHESGKPFEAFNLDELDEFWRDAKGKIVLSSRNSQ